MTSSPLDLVALTFLHISGAAAFIFAARSVYAYADMSHISQANVAALMSRVSGVEWRTGSPPPSIMQTGQAFDDFHLLHLDRSRRRFPKRSHLMMIARKKVNKNGRHLRRRSISDRPQCQRVITLMAAVVSARSELAAVPIPRDGPVTGELIVRALHILTAGLIIRHCTSVEPPER